MGAFIVKDKDPAKQDDVLGMATLTCEQFTEAGFEGELQLSNAGSTEAFLKVRVEIGEKVKPEPEQVAGPTHASRPEPILESKAAPIGLCCRAPKPFCVPGSFRDRECPLSSAWCTNFFPNPTKRVLKLSRPATPGAPVFPNLHETSFDAVAASNAWRHAPHSKFKKRKTWLFAQTVKGTSDSSK